MALQIITGGSGSGKSTYVCEQILKEGELHPEKKYFVIVPDQFTMQTQMDFVNKSSCGGIMNIDILSFSRLAHRIFEETGGSRKPVLDDTGKSLILRKIAGTMKDQVPVIGNNLNKQGYIHEVKSAVSEFMQYGIGEEQLEAMIEYAKSRGALYYKLKDLQVLYRAFREYIRDHYITTEESMDILAKELYRSDLIVNSVVVFDGFTGFTPIQENVIGVLLEICDQVIVTVTTEQGEDRQNQELFAFADKTVSRLTKLAMERKIEILPVLRMQQKYRFAGREELSFLEKHILRYPLVSYKGKETQRIRISFHKDMSMEIRFLCRQIRRVLKESGCAYRDIAVIAGDLSAYESCIENEFRQYDLPFFMDKTRGIELNPFIEYIKSALSVLTDQFSYESVFHFLRSGLADFTWEEIDDLENYVLEMGICGRKAWSHAFAGRTRGMKEREDGLEQLTYINALRERLIEQLHPLLYGKEERETTGNRTFTVNELVTRLYAFVVDNQIEEKLAGYAAYFESCFQNEEQIPNAETNAKQIQNDGIKIPVSLQYGQADARAKEYRQIYRLVMELLDQIIELIGTEKLSLKEFADILEAGFAEIEVGTIPKSVDRIIVGDIERTRLKQVKYLFFVGVNDGNIPQKTSKGGIISDIDREYLKGSEQELAPSPRDQMYIQQYYLYLNLTKPSEGLYLSYIGMDAEGAALRPSYLIGMMKKMFPECMPECGETQEDLYIGNMGEAKEVCTRLLLKYADQTITFSEQERLMQLLSFLGKEKGNRDLLQHWIENAYYEKKDAVISRTAAGLLFGDTILSSISRMEKYASCAYSYFLEYGLSLKERQLYGFESKDMGTIFHGVMERFSEKLQENHVTWLDFSDEEGKRWVSESMEEVCIGYSDALLYENALNRYSMERMEKILQKCVFNISYQLGKGRFMPKEYEVAFQTVENLQELDITLTEKDKIRLTGRIDRLDTYEKDDKIYVKVIDYKSGDKNFDLAAFYYGTQLQLVVYMREAMRHLEKENPGREAVGAAMLYYHMDDPIVEGNAGISKEAVNQKIKEALRMKGIINSDGEILEALDTSKTQKSDCVPLDYDSKGGLKATVNAYDKEQIRMLSDYASYSLKNMGVRIKKGEISKNPYISGSQDACAYCAYQDVCGFDEKLPGHKKRNLKKDADMDYLEKIKEVLT